ncbi:unnamed protein product [Gongylonema pulchrum]|uniref:Deacetylase sirtuin-type domain-containing protein n=1 Tax=Gongylonema pulchrum TaxID=637853 RepID=A0A183DZD0_9BILA|nr:unnamed protein product [Gongylonema pulchrum]
MPSEGRESQLQGKNIAVLDDDSFRSGCSCSEAGRQMNSVADETRGGSAAQQHVITLESGKGVIVEQMANKGVSPREIVRCLLPDISLPDDLSDDDLCHIVQEILCSEQLKRAKLPQFNTFDDAVELFRRLRCISHKCSRILVLTGAGVSVSCGIPDFRSTGGIYARLHVEYPDLPDPTAMFDIRYFSRNPKPFFEFARVCSLCF